MFTYVYVLLNPKISGYWSFNNKEFEYQPFYVGIGVDRRCYEHFNLNRIKYESNFTKFNLIKKLIDDGTPPILIKIYENINREEAKKIEINFIKLFGKTIDNSGILVNITDGGDETKVNKLGEENQHSKNVYQYSLNGCYKKKWGCLREVGRKLNKSYNTIGDCCRGKTKTAYGYQWFYEYKGKKIEPIGVREQPSLRKKIYKFDNKGKLIKSYKSLTDAASQNNLLKSTLSDVINNNGFHCDFFYSYDENFKPIKNLNARFHKIIYNGDTMFLTNKEIIENFNVSVG